MADTPTARRDPPPDPVSASSADPAATDGGLTTRREPHAAHGAAGVSRKKSRQRLGIPKPGGAAHPAAVPVLVADDGRVDHVA